MLSRSAIGPTRRLAIAQCRPTVIWQRPWRPSATLPWPADTAPYQAQRTASTSSSSSRWKTRQSDDHLAREAKVAGLKSRAAYKLLEIDRKYRIFSSGQTVVDLGYAPGSWSQVAVNRTKPSGRVVGIDIIPTQPPRGASSIQGNFLSERVQAEVREYVREWGRGRIRVKAGLSRQGETEGESGNVASSAEELEQAGKSVVEMEKEHEHEYEHTSERQNQADEVNGAQTGDHEPQSIKEGLVTRKDTDLEQGRVVDVVLSDMSEPWPLVAATWVKSVSNPYRRMMNTSGMPFRDHAGSMDLCLAALTFCFDALASGGHFLCKFYQGNEDKVLEGRLKKLFEKVYRIKPDSSRKESREAYFVALRRRANVDREKLFYDS